MTYERDEYMKRQEMDHDLLRMRTRWPCDHRRPITPNPSPPNQVPDK